MKKKFLVVLILMLFSYVYAQNNQEIFLQANQAYEQNDVQKAAMLYESITNKGAAVWYNLGNCYYMQERFVDAFVCWKRAQLQFVPHIYQAAERNSASLLAKFDITQKRFSFDIAKQLSVYGSPLLWQIAFFIAWIMLFILFAFRKSWLILSVNGMFVALLAVVVVMKFNDLTRKSGIINDDAIVFIGPGDYFAVQSKIPQMNEVIIKNKVDSWYNVVFTEGNGWVSVDKISLIN